ESVGYATLLEWDNILYEPTQGVLDTPKHVVRVGAVQWQLREVGSLDEMLEQVEYFVDAVSDYQSDFVVFPELFSAPLMGLHEHKSQTEAIRFLATLTEEVRDRMSRMAIEYNANIIAGSMP